MNVTTTWWITTAPLSEGGQKVAGPYASQEEALKERVVLEAPAGVTYWVDDEPEGGKP